MNRIHIGQRICFKLRRRAGAVHPQNSYTETASKNGTELKCKRIFCMCMWVNEYDSILKSRAGAIHPAGSSELSRGAANYHLGSTLLPTCRLKIYMCISQLSVCAVSSIWSNTGTCTCTLYNIPTSYVDSNTIPNPFTLPSAG